MVSGALAAKQRTSARAACDVWKRIALLRCALAYCCLAKRGGQVKLVLVTGARMNPMPDSESVKLLRSNSQTAKLFVTFFTGASGPS